MKYGIGILADVLSLHASPDDDLPTPNGFTEVPEHVGEELQRFMAVNKGSIDWKRDLIQQVRDSQSANLDEQEDAAHWKVLYDKEIEGKNILNDEINRLIASNRVKQNEMDKMRTILEDNDLRAQTSREVVLEDQEKVREMKEQEDESVGDGDKV